MIDPDRLHLEHADTAWTGLTALEPVRRAYAAQSLERRRGDVAADSRPAALYVAEIAARTHRTVEPYAIGAALALLAIIGAIALHLARVIA